MSDIPQDTQRVIREDDPQVAQLQEHGWTIVASSWGARLQYQDSMRTHLLALTEIPKAWELRELESGDASKIIELDRLCAQDYPQQTSSFHLVPDAEVLSGQLKNRDRRAFGALDDNDILHAVTVTEPLADRVETDFTCVHPFSRGRGLATAVKAFTILMWVSEGATTFGTGGASINEASLRANQSVGYELEPLWLTLASPDIGPTTPPSDRGEH